MKFIDATGLATLWEKIKSLIDSAITEISVATTSANGLMSSEDKAEHDNLVSSLSNTGSGKVTADDIAYIAVNSGSTVTHIPAVHSLACISPTEQSGTTITSYRIGTTDVPADKSNSADAVGTLYVDISNNILVNYYGNTAYIQSTKSGIKNKVRLGDYVSSTNYLFLCTSEKGHLARFPLFNSIEIE